ncbi:hypothetical protein [Microbacterium sp. 2MCAF23]|uniref:hypothetical protein n=1 Tax=Microbacterium sp. 2MCAF23 TaxID=3232985 RepID=UPI003F943CF5
MRNPEMPADGSEPEPDGSVEPGGSVEPVERTIDQRPVRLGAAWDLAVIMAAAAADDMAEAAAASPMPSCTRSGPRAAEHPHTMARRAIGSVRA